VGFRPRTLLPEANDDDEEVKIRTFENENQEMAFTKG
jgi:hypothetical protein